MASVYRAEDTSLRREVAVKVLHPHLLRSEEHKARFLREARAAAKLDHPGISRILDVDEGEGDDEPFIVMELLRGPTLKAFIDEHGPPLAEIAALIGAALAEALAVAHDAGVIHRDVKPANVMVSGDRIVLCDFGVARVLDDDALATQSGLMLGTPVFMPPEQAMGRKVDVRSDVYSLGATVYQVATGQPPFGGSAAAVVQQVLRGQLVPPARRDARIGGDLNAVIERAMAREPDARYATARELGAALSAVAAASGFTDARAELTAFFEDPDAHAARSTERVVKATVARARAAADQGKVARSLALAERALAFDPANAEAGSLLARVGVAWKRRRQAAWLAGIAAVAGGAGIVAVLWPQHGPIPPTSPPGDPTHQPAGFPTVIAAVADAAPARLVVSPPPRPSPPDAAPAPSIPDAAPPPAAPDAAPATRPKKPSSRPAPVDAGVPAARLPDAAVRVAAPPPAPATVDVIIRPWCDLSIDGVSRGRSPTRASISLPAGSHELVCRQPDREVKRTLDLAPGEHRVVRESLYPPIDVHIEVRDAKIDGKPASGTIQLTPGSHRLEMPGKAARYFEFPTHSCTLRELPELGCY